MKEESKDLESFNFVGSGWDVEGIDYIKINILVEKDRLIEIEPNEKGFIKLVVCRKKDVIEGKPPYYVREFKRKIK